MGEAALKIDRYFSPADGEVYSTKKWEDRSAFLNDEHGNEVFRQDGVSFPTDWSQLATNVVSSKYFYGKNEWVYYCRFVE